jgi:Uma2 family endonuclease
MFDLEWVLYWGLPENKCELWDGCMHCVFPFASQGAAEHHFAAWAERLACWQQAQPETVRNGSAALREIAVGSFHMTVHPRPIALNVPVDGAAFRAIYESFWRRDLWPTQPPGRETGWDSALIHSEVRHGLWRIFREWTRRHGGQHGSTDIVVSDSVVLSPTHYYFARSSGECLVRRDYFVGVPDLAVDVLSPATRFLARGRRMDIYYQVGVPYVWLIEPELETLEMYERSSREYRHVRTCRSGDAVQCCLFPDSDVPLDELFDTQVKRLGWRQDSEEPQSPSEWLVPPEVRLGLQYLLLLGHSERRREVWHNRGRCLLSFASATESRQRFQHFLEDICRWQQQPPVRPEPAGPELELAEVGPFQLVRNHQRIELEVRFESHLLRELYDLWFNRNNWDWGED